MKRPSVQPYLFRFANGVVLSLSALGMGASLAPLYAQGLDRAALISPESMIASGSKAKGTKANPWKAPKKGLPGSREDGGTRADAGKSMSVFAPAGGVVALAAEEPSLMVRLDESMASRQVNLLVTDQAGDVIYDKDFQVAGRTGIFRMDLAEEDLKQSLESSQEYDWNLMALPEDPRALDFGSDQNPVVSGKFRRLQPGDGSGLDEDIAQDLAEASPFGKARLVYEELGHWHECAIILSKIMEDPNTSPEDLAKANQAWTQVMTYGGHEEIAAEMPIPSPMEEVDVMAIFH